MPPVRTIAFNLRDALSDPDQREWDLPAWGHDASLMVMPLFMTVEDRLIPIGSAFALGGGIGLVMSALHNIMHAIAQEPRFDQRRIAGTLSGSITLDTIGLSVLHQVPHGPTEHALSLLPLTTIEGAPPTDLVIGSVRMPERTPTLSLPLSFAIPARGDTVWSLGYHDFRYPAAGIPVEAAASGRFDWQRDYGHRFTVVEARIEAAFTGRFSSAFLDAPCFAFDESIAHGMSGGPVISEAGYLIGLNSAGAEGYFNRPMSIGSMLYPMLLHQIRFSGTMGPLTINGSRPLLALLQQGTLSSDGSEQLIGFSELDHAERPAIHAVAPLAHDAIFDDFAGYQAGRRATSYDGPIHHLVQREADSED